jgi:uncharacterized membrane protein
MQAPSFVLRQLDYNLANNLLFRPGWMIALYLLLGVGFPVLEKRLVEKSLYIATLSRWLATEPGTAQTLLATVAGSLMTVVSVVYSILLVALSLASIQFSTRIVAGFMRDRISQSVLGQFIGSFVYCLAVLWSIHSDPPEVPGISLTLGLGLALVSMAGLVLFIDHIVRSIQANHLVDKIATETEGIIDSVFSCQDQALTYAPSLPPLPHKLRSDRSGYIQLIDIQALAEKNRVLEVLKPMGSFVAAGAPLVACEELSPEESSSILEQFDIGAERTMQDDVEFGFRQIVDIALKAISPAVNDPSTAATCIDHLGRLLVRVASRPGPRLQFGKAYLPNTSIKKLLELSIDQIRQYGRSDMAVAIRLARILSEVYEVLRDEEAKKLVQEHAGVIWSNATHHFSGSDLSELHCRLSRIVPLPSPKS